MFGMHFLWELEINLWLGFCFISAFILILYIFFSKFKLTLAMCPLQLKFLGSNQELWD